MSDTKPAMALATTSPEPAEAPTLASWLLDADEALALILAALPLEDVVRLVVSRAWVTCARALVRGPPWQEAQLRRSFFRFHQQWTEGDETTTVKIEVQRAEDVWKIVVSEFAAMEDEEDIPSTAEELEMGMRYEAKYAGPAAPFAEGAHFGTSGVYTKTDGRCVGLGEPFEVRIQQSLCGRAGDYNNVPVPKTIRARLVLGLGAEPVLGLVVNAPLADATARRNLGVVWPSQITQTVFCCARPLARLDDHSRLRRAPRYVDFSLCPVRGWQGELHMPPGLEW